MKQGKVYFAISYKGGTGRSVASANLAYQFSRLGRSVALVDLDLGASTMHHVCRILDDAPEMDLEEALLLDQRLEQVSDSLLARWLEVGESELSHPRNIRNENLYNRNNIIADGKKNKTLAHHNRSGEFKLYANNARDTILTTVTTVDLRDRLTQFLSYVSSKHAHVICDLRSGDSKLLQALCHPQLQMPVTPMWLLFFRHTPQHLSAVRSLVECLDSYFKEAQTALDRNVPTLDMRLVPTASLSLEGDEVISSTAKNLAAHVRSRADTQIRALEERYNVRQASISLPYENALLFAEGILGTGDKKVDYFSEISRLARELDEEQRGS